MAQLLSDNHAAALRVAREGAVLLKNTLTLTLTLILTLTLTLILTLTLTHTLTPTLRCGTAQERGGSAGRGGRAAAVRE